MNMNHKINFAEAGAAFFHVLFVAAFLAAVVFTVGLVSFSGPSVRNVMNDAMVATQPLMSVLTYGSLGSIAVCAVCSFCSHLLSK